MGEVESIIWHVLGYSAMPVIFISGFIGVFVVSAGILRLFSEVPVED